MNRRYSGSRNMAKFGEVTEIRGGLYAYISSKKLRRVTGWRNTLTPLTIRRNA